MNDSNTNASSKIDSVQVSEEALSVVVVSKADAPYHSKVVEGLYKKLREMREGYFDCYKYLLPRNVDWHTAHEVIDQIVHQEPDLVVTIGALCTQVASDSIKANKKKIPLLFGGVTLPYEMGILDRNNKTIGVSGVSLGFPSHIISAAVPLLIKPELKTLLLIYDPSAESRTLVNAALLIRQYLDNKGVRVSLLPLDACSHGVLDIIRNELKTVESAMTLSGCPFSDMAVDLIRLCEESDVLFFASDLSTVRKGAIAGFAADPHLVGEKLAEYVISVVVDKKSPETLSVKFLGNDGRRLAINRDVLKRKKITLCPATEYLINHGEVIGECSISDEHIVEFESYEEHNEV